MCTMSSECANFKRYFGFIQLLSNNESFIDAIVTVDVSLLAIMLLIVVVLIVSD